jgi:effector-binding domain-containing protein
MRRKSLLVIIALLIIIAVIAWAPLHFEIKKEIRIETPIEYVGRQFTDLRHWKNWNVAVRRLDSSGIKYSASSSGINAFLQSGDLLFTIIQTNPAFVLVRSGRPGTREYHSLYAVSDSFGKSTEVTWTRSLPPARWLKEKIIPDGEMEEGLKNLKNTLEDPLHIYGFPIRIGPVTDTLVITCTATCAKKDKIAELNRLYQGIYGYAKRRKMPVADSRMANFTFRGKDSLQIDAGIPTSVNGDPENNISVLRMPTRGRMLIGSYEGPYSGLGKLYSAMGKYTRDKRLMKVAAVYEKYLTDPKSATDSLHMKIELCFPVF